MNVIFSDQTLESVGSNSIFLAGPTPRDKSIKSWRVEALELLEAARYSGTVLVPERTNWIDGFDYNTQIEWEFYGLVQAGAIVFWVPSEKETMPALATRTEFGMFMALNHAKVCYGRPEGAWKTGYLDWWYKRLTCRDPQTTLSLTLAQAIEQAEEWKRPVFSYFNRPQR